MTVKPSKKVEGMEAYTATLSALFD